MIRFTYNEQNYVLEFTKSTVKRLDDNGFTLEKLAEYPSTYIPIFFHAAFLANHKFIKREKTEEIYATLEKKGEVISALSQMYVEQVNGLFDEPNEGNATAWTMD
jgi:hypothetical protein